ncbi:MAG: hypothetical protein ACOC7R_02065, partial [Planctomycetota bacterium]
GVEALGVLAAVAAVAAVGGAGRLVPADLAPLGLGLRLVAGGWWMLLLREHYTHLTRQITFARRHPTVTAGLPGA